MRTGANTGGAVFIRIFCKSAADTSNSLTPVSFHDFFSGSSSSAAGVSVGAFGSGVASLGVSGGTAPGGTKTRLLTDVSLG